METAGPMKTQMGISEARAKLTSLANDVYRGEARIVVEKSGIPVAALVSPRDLERLERLDRTDAEELVLLQDIRGRFDDTEEDELIQRAVEAIAEVRAERRGERLAAGETAEAGR